MVVFSIIGARGDSMNRSSYFSYDITMYNTMVNKTQQIISSLGYSNSEVDLITGGCSFSDHVAITLFNTMKSSDSPYKSLTIYSPCNWDYVRQQYHESKSNECGMLLNRLHKQFSKRCTINSLEEIQQTILLNPNVTFNDKNTTFFSRNTRIAVSSDYMIAFGWSLTSETLQRSGTKYTISQFKSKCITEELVNERLHYINMKTLF